MRRLTVLAALLLPLVPLGARDTQTVGGAAPADAYLKSEVTKRRIPGISVAVIHDGNVIFTQSYGFANLELSVPASRETVYEIASLTKPFTAIAVMMLAEAGRVSLDDPISRHLAAAPREWRDITIRHLLTNTSGIPDYFTIPALRSTRGGIWPNEYTAGELSRIFFGTQLEFTPGSRFAYSNSGYWLLGQVIEVVTGESYERYLVDRVFAPLDMKVTRLMDRKAIMADRAAGYTWRENVLLNAPYTTNTWAYSEGGLVSSISDLTKWDIGLWTGKLLKPTTLDLMVSPIPLPDGTRSNYGLGWSIGSDPKRRQIYHTGDKPGFSAMIRRYLDERLTVIILANVDNGLDIGGMTFQLAGYFASPR